jgi:hypothetical protein
MNTILLSKGIALALEQGETVYDIAKATGLSKTEVLNMADNANSRDYSHLEQPTMKTHRAFESQILARAFDFAVQKAGRAYLKAKDAALKARGNQQAELIEEAKIRRQAFINASNCAPEETQFADIVTEYCGLGREWNANGKMVTQFAEANGIDQQLAADLVGRQMIVAQDYAQATRGVKFGRYLSWLEDAASEATGEETPNDLEEIVLDAYKRAAQWNQPGDGLLIREFAESMGISDILPTWAECLKANMPTAEQAMEARKRMSNRAAAAASAEQEAEQELTQTYGSF